MTTTVLLYLVLGYLCGSIPFAYLVGRSRGKNIFEIGSGNPGATNTMLMLGKQAAVIVLLCDVIKGAVPTLLVNWITGDTSLAMWTATGAVLGHAFCIYTKFRGGKALATAGGALLVLFPLGVIAMVALYIALLFLIRYIVIATTIVIFTAVGLFLWTNQPPGSDIAFLVMVAGVLFRHLANWERVFLRNEPKIGNSVEEVTLQRLPVSKQRLIAVLYVLAAGIIIAAVWLTQ